MSIFGTIMTAIFAGGAKSQTTETSNTDTVGSPPIAASTLPRPSGPWQPADVDSVLTRLAGQKKENLDWRASIIDLLKALDLDSSLAARKELARELHYAGEISDTAAMNTWLHKQVMIKLAQHGGKVPEQLLA
jgi:hypothetical protein